MGPCLRRSGGPTRRARAVRSKAGTLLACGQSCGALADFLQLAPPSRDLEPHISRHAQHGEARRASASDALSEALKRPRDRQHSRRDFDATEHGILGGYDEVAVESELETAAERDPLDRGDRRHPERFDGAVREIDLCHKGAKPVDVLTGPFPHLAAEAEVWSFCFDQHNADIAFTRVMDSLPKTFRKPQVEPVERRIGKNDAPDGVVAFEPDAAAAA